MLSPRVPVEGRPARSDTVILAGVAVSPLDANVDALFMPLQNAAGVVLAVSGGPDSVAMMLLVAAWARKMPGRPRLAVATVDHGLRAQSHREAETVGLWAAALGLPHAILDWEGDKPKTRLQERARAARYDLLFRHARAVGADHVVTAHHADDQAETILFRLIRGSGIAGLAGMLPARRHGDMWHVRPLLGCDKDALVAVCRAHDHPFFADPSNENPVFARARLRRLMPLLAAEGLTRESLLRLGRRASRADSALAARVQTVRASLQAERTADVFAASLRHLANEPEEILLRLVTCEIEALGSTAGRRLDRLETLARGLRSALQGATGWRGTLGGMTLVLATDGVLTIRREGLRRRGRATARRGMESAARRQGGAPGQARQADQ